jgi:hypothetical protein
MSEDNVAQVDQADAESVDDQSAKPTKSYSKAEVDAMVNKAKVSTRREFGDYLDLKTKAEEYDKLQESSKTNEDKLRESYAKAVRERDVALTRAQSTLIRSAIISTASRLGSVDPEAVAALVNREELVVEGDEVIGVEDAVKALLAKKSYLRQGASRGGAELQGSGQEPAVITRTQIQKWAREGGLTTERQAQINDAYKAGRVLPT